MKRTIYFMKEWQGVGKFICLSFGIALFGMSDYCSAAMRGTNSPGVDANDADLQAALRLSQQEWEENNPEIQAAIRASLQPEQNLTNPHGVTQPRLVSPIPEINDVNNADLQEVLHRSRLEWEEEDPELQAAIRASLQPEQNLTNPHGVMQPRPANLTGVMQPRPASPIQDVHEEEEDPELQEALRLSRQMAAGGENDLPLPASGHQPGLANEPQNDAQIRLQQDRDFAAALADELARRQAVEQRAQETNAPIANPGEQVNLQTPEKMFEGLTGEELEAIACPPARKNDFINRAFVHFRVDGSLEDRFYAILKGLEYIHRLNRNFPNPGYQEVMKKLIRAWGEAFNNWNGHNQMLDRLKPIAENLPEGIISPDTLMLLP